MSLTTSFLSETATQRKKRKTKILDPSQTLQANLTKTCQQAKIPALFRFDGAN